MGFVRKGADIEERSFSFALSVIRATKRFPKSQEAFIISGQLIRSATSISANLVEGSAAISRKEFIQFVSFARKSAIETAHWLRYADALEFVADLGQLLQEGEEIVKILSAIILKSKQ